jgi:chitosanase
VDARRAWLAGHANPLLHKTVYRMDAFRALIATGKWGLELPLTVRDVVLTEGLLAGAPMSPTRLLQRTQPPMCGDDVRAAQRRLGFAEPEVDGVYGPKTEAAVRAFQQARGLTVDGCVGPITRAMLEV